MAAPLAEVYARVSRELTECFATCENVEEVRSAFDERYPDTCDAPTLALRAAVLVAWNECEYPHPLCGDYDQGRYLCVDGANLRAVPEPCIEYAPTDCRASQCSRAALRYAIRTAELAASGLRTVPLSCVDARYAELVAAAAPIVRGVLAEQIPDETAIAMFRRLNAARPSPPDPLAVLAMAVAWNATPSPWARVFANGGELRFVA